MSENTLTLEQRDRLTRASLATCATILHRVCDREGIDLEDVEIAVNGGKTSTLAVMIPAWLAIAKADITVNETEVEK